MHAKNVKAVAVEMILQHHFTVFCKLHIHNVIAFF